ncbi:MAG TPA: COQ9 family protein [Alphaproteobacteria bacterium]|jgi:ubiquinone biosynthesis protein COQ9
MTDATNPQSNTPGAEEPQLPGIRARLLAGLMRNAPFDGWSERALAAAARDAGVTPEMAEIAFPGGLAGAALALHEEFDRRTAEALAAHDLESLKIRERITLAVRTRLELSGPDREAFRALATFLASPLNVGLGARLMWRTVDSLWRAVGDRSTDFTYYSKRATLGAVWGSTLMVWLQDGSEDFAETWAFLDRRIADVMAIEACKARVRQMAARLPDPFGLFRRPTSGPRP